MDPGTLVDTFARTLYITMVLIAIIVGPSLIVGLIIAMFQAATQINEASLSFIPKLFVTFLTLVVAGPWLLHLLIDYAQGLIHDIPYLIG